MNKPILLAAFGIVALLSCSVGWAQYVPSASQPTAKATARPAAPAILVLPFNNLGGGEAAGWMSQALQQNMVVDLSRTGSVAVLATARRPEVPPLVDVQEAMKEGQDVRADLVVYGTYVVTDRNVRVTGQILDVATGRLVGTLKSTGTLDQWFMVEDDLSAQLKQVLAAAGVIQPETAQGTPTPVYGGEAYGSSYNPPPMQYPVPETYVYDYAYPVYPEYYNYTPYCPPLSFGVVIGVDGKRHYQRSYRDGRLDCDDGRYRDRLERRGEPVGGKDRQFRGRFDQRDDIAGRNDQQYIKVDPPRQPASVGRPPVRTGANSFAGNPVMAPPSTVVSPNVDTARRFQPARSFERGPSYQPARSPQPVRSIQPVRSPQPAQSFQPVRVQERGPSYQPVRSPQPVRSFQPAAPGYRPGGDVRSAGGMRGGGGGGRGGGGRR